MMLLLMLAAAAAAQSGWNIKETTSKLDGAVSYSASLQSSDTVTDIIGNPKHAALVADCGKTGLTIMLDWPDFVQAAPDDMNVTVLWKTDAGQLMKTGMIPVSQAAGLKGKRALVWFDGLSTAKSLVVSIPDGHGGQEATFDLSGISDVSAKLHGSGCHV